MYKIAPSSYTILALLGSMATLSHAQDSQINQRGNTVTCTINAWLWQGQLGTEFLDPNNWFNCSAFIPGPTTDLPIYIGPIEHTINGIPQSITYPTNPSILQLEYSNPSLTMANGTDTFFTVSNTTYTCGSGIIGTPHQAAGATGLATLTLDNSVWDGSLTIGQSGGNGKLLILGSSLITGNLSVGSGNASIENSGQFQLSNSQNNNSAGNISWTNSSGSELVLNNANFHRSWPDQPADLIVEPGATLTKTGTNSNSIGWDFRNEGTVNVQDGYLGFSQSYNSANGQINVFGGSASVNGQFTGHTTVNVSDGASFNISGEPFPAASFDIYGDLTFGSISTGGDILLDGDFRVTGGSSLSASIVNLGRAEIASSFNNSSAGPASWTNPSGIELVLNNANFHRSWPDQPADLIVEPGATLTKTGTNSNSIGWDFRNEGTVNVQEGYLGFSQSYNSANGQINVLGGSASVNGQFTGHTTVNVSDGASFNISGEPFPAASFDIYGDLTFGSISTGGDILLDGDFRVTGGSSLSASIVNLGRAEIASSFNNSSAGPAMWTNPSGSELVLNNANFHRSWPDQPADLILEAGATLTKTGANAISIGWDFRNEGTVNVQEGNLTIMKYLPSEGTLNIHNGTLQINNSDVKFKTGNSVIAGAGTLRLPNSPAMQNNGSIAPGFPDPKTNPDGLTIDVPFLQLGDNSLFTVQVGSIASKLTCTGIADIGGAIDVQRIGDIEPDGSEVFTVLEADFATGVLHDYFTNAVPAFGNIAIDVRTGGLEYDVEYTDTSIIIKNISAFTPPCSPADFNGDQTLDFFDVSAFLSLFGAQDPSADLTDDGVIDFFDVSSFLQIFGKGCP